MSHLFWLDEEHLKRIRHMFPKPRGVKRADDRRVLSGVIHVIRNGLRWRDAPSEYGPHKTLYNRFVRWSRIGVFARIFRELARRVLHFEHSETRAAERACKLVVARAQIPEPVCVAECPPDRWLSVGNRTRSLKG
jgi:transposase